jgi:hypothetical protein
MRAAKLLLTCLICLGVSIQGFASVVAVETPCPMAQAGTESAAEQAPNGDSNNDCCTDAATFAKNGKMCKSGLACQPAGQAPQVVLAVVSTVSLFKLIAPLPAPLIVSVDLSFVWRPPALI